VKVVYLGVAAGDWTSGRSPSSVSIQTADGGWQLVDADKLFLAQELWDSGEVLVVDVEYVAVPSPSSLPHSITL